MNNTFPSDRRARSARTAGWILAGLMALLATLSVSPAAAADATLSKDSQACQECHDKPDIKMKTGDGKIWKLSISTEAYLKSRHDTTDCADCHDDLDEKHADTKPAVKSRRDHAKKLNDGCASCHKKHVKQYGDSVHAAMVKDGSDKAPLCSDCHDVHTLRSVKIVRPIAEAPCMKCHEEIGKAYAGDVHGLERVAHGKAAPLCNDCHQAHAIQAASSDGRLKDACFSCHKDAVAQHKGWLPNAGLHFEAISCPVCHAPEAERRVNLRLFDAKGRQLAEKSGVPRFEKLAQAAGLSAQGLDEAALRSLLQQIGTGQTPGDAVLHGRLEVRNGLQAHRLAEKEKAISDCDTCHRQGSAAFQSVVLTIAGADGRPLRATVDNKVLTSLVAIDSVRGFYAIGANRIKLLDWLLLAVVLGAIGGVSAHATMKWASRRIRARLAAEKENAAP